ncbi:MAG: 4Fe-4S dicluster domain-containing protein [Oscillospiraceae bacterium]|nr:4Fe-4S dicluster domain-containing protein [Oscillospiraceae bacterium]
MNEKFTTLVNVRRKVFAAVAKMSYDGGNLTDYAAEIRRLPYEIIPGEARQHRESIFLERAIVSERIRLAMGLPLRPIDQPISVSEGLEYSVIAEKYYDPPLINIIKFACHACPEKLVEVTKLCQHCLAHPCVTVCPKKAVSLKNNTSVIDHRLCINCGKCADVCPYHAIVQMRRPCEQACGMNAICSDELGRAQIDHDRCVSCGQCLVSCPFGAIADKGQIFQLIQAMQTGKPVYALLAPSFINQFPQLPIGKIRNAFRALGFSQVVEVAVGADLCAIDEARLFSEKVPGEIPFMGTSCCPAWSVMAKKDFPTLANTISMAMTPMVLTARMIHSRHPEAKICFIGPCAAKKLEASRHRIRSQVDFVLTFEELMAMFKAKAVDFAALEEEKPLTTATAAGRGFAVSGGVASAVKELIEKEQPGREVPVMSAQGLTQCHQMLQLAKAGKFNGYLLEGMACPGGCMGGVGTLSDPQKSATQLRRYQNQAKLKTADQSKFINLLPLLVEEPDAAP